MADEVEGLTEAENGAEAAEQQEEWQPSEVDQVAMELGWRPQSEWKGEAGEWVDSKAYLTKTRDMNKSMSKELRDMRKQIDGIGKATSRMTQAAVDAERAKWQEKWDEAFESGDKTGLKAAEKQLAQLDQPQNEGPSDAARDFASRHSSWFEKDDEATGYAFTRASYWQGRGVTDPAEQLAKVEQDVKKRFPELFEDAKETRKAPPALGTPQRSITPQLREKGYATLPPQARKAADQWANAQRENNGWTDKQVESARSDWAKHYYEQEAANG